MQDRCTYRWAKSSGLNPEPISRPVNHSPMLLGHGPATVSLPQGKVLMACVRQSEDCSSSLRTSMRLDKSLPDLYYVWVQQRGDGGEMKAKLHQPWRTTDHKLWQKTGQKPSLWSGEDGTSCEWALGSFLLWGARTICLKHPHDIAPSESWGSQCSLSVFYPPQWVESETRLCHLTSLFIEGSTWAKWSWAVKLLPVMKSTQRPLCEAHPKED